MWDYFWLLVPTCKHVENLDVGKIYIFPTLKGISIFVYSHEN